MIVEKDINGVEYSYENKDELAFGTYFEEEAKEELEIIQLVPRMYAKKLQYNTTFKELWLV